MRGLLAIWGFVVCLAPAWAQAPAMQPPVLGQAVLLTWTNNAPPPVTFNVYSVNAACPLTTAIPGPPTLTGITATSAILTAVGPGGYCYAVTAVSNGAESGQSNQAAVTILPGKYDDLGVGDGLMKVGAGAGQPVTLSIDTTVTALVNVSTVVPASCQIANQILFQAQHRANGQLSSFKILLCDPVTRTYKNLPLYKQGG